VGNNNRRRVVEPVIVADVVEPVVDAIVAPVPEPESTVDTSTPDPVVVDPVEPVAPSPVPIPSIVAASPWVAAGGDDKPIPVNRHTGRYTGMKIEQFQNRLYRWNRDGFNSVAPDGTVRPVGLTDYQIAVMWAVEFPGARCDYMAHVDYVASTRTMFVNGRHPSPDPDATGCGVTFGIDGAIAAKPYRGPARTR